MIGAIAGVIICAILLASKGFSYEHVGGLLGTILITYWSIKQMIDLSRIWSRKIITAIKNEHTYLMSIPQGKMEEAARLVNLYLSNK